MPHRTLRPVAHGLRAVARHSRRIPLAQQRRLFMAALVALDALMLAAAFGLAYWLRFGVSLEIFQHQVLPAVGFYRLAILVLIPAWLVLFRLFGLYDEHNLLGGTREYALVFNAVTTGLLLIIVAAFLQPELLIARGWVLSSWLLAFLLVAGTRFMVRRIVYRLRARGWLLAPALVVGTNDEALALAQQLVSWRASGLAIAGFVAHDKADGRRLLRNLYALGTLDDLERLVDEHGIEELVIATSALSREQLVGIFRAYATRRDVQLRLSSGLFEVMTTGLRIKEMAFVPLIDVTPVRLRGADRLLKAALDLSVAGTVVVLGAPILLLLAAIVRLDSPGPILHRRRVLGLGGTSFEAFKFRTMRHDADAILAAHPELARQLATTGKLRHDPRITRTGNWLRKLSLDELPQAFNVLRREMSIVGPRMISPGEHERYGRWDLNLLTVRPGITGLWQVSGRSDLSYEDRVRLDMNYIRNWTIWLDLQILLQTIPAVLFGRGAY